MYSFLQALDPACTVFGASCEFATLVATWSLVVGTIASVWIQFIFTRRTLTADLFTRLNERWDGPTMRARRRALANALQKGRAEDIPPTVVEDVIDFFEDLGGMLRKHWLDDESVWNSFSVSCRHYWKACGETYVVDYRRRYQDDTYFSEFEFLSGRMTEFERKRRKKKHVSDVAFSSEHVHDFLTMEASLT
jgi:hypothetical protein